MGLRIGHRVGNEDKYRGGRVAGAEHGRGGYVGYLKMFFFRKL